jgi:iron-sulfur cluster insertion protein
MDQISITDNARARIKDILIDENDPSASLRIFVQGGGCSGFSYGFTLDHIQNDDDWVIDLENFKALVDVMSMQYLQGATIDYKETLMSSEFVIVNPNAVSTCGCGSSFSI